MTERQNRHLQFTPVQAQQKKVGELGSSWLGALELLMPVYVSQHKGTKSSAALYSYYNQITHHWLTVALGTAVLAL